MKQRNLLLILVLAIVTISSAFAAKPKAKHVIWIGLDRCGAYSVEKAEMPVTKQFMKDGSYTLKKRSVLPSSSAVNWLPCLWEQVRRFTDIPNGALKHLNFLHAN